jgi:tetratricopeptide (TPR) repeat protein
VASNEIALETERATAGDSPQAAFTAGHYGYWLLYGLLQQGRYTEARKLMDAVAARVQENPTVAERRYFVPMRARYVIDTGDWDGAAAYTAESAALDPVYQFTDAISAIYLGDLDAARGHLAAMRPVSEQYETAGTAEVVAVMKRQIEGLLAIAEGDADAGIEMLRESVALDEKLPLKFGPPSVVQPASELLAKALLEQGEFEEAAMQYERQLTLTPRRAQSLFGLAMAQDAAGMADAAKRTREQLAQVWKKADVNVGGYGAVAQEISDTL